ncbi:hypothetical protein COCNU_scaffold016575G000100 [Cocos nucifera]|nr:hypothetical protein [Cocos nucifera]
MSWGRPYRLAIRPLMLSDAKEETVNWIFGFALPLLSKLLFEENLFKVGLTPTDLKTRSSCGSFCQDDQRGGEDLKEKIKWIFLDLNLGLQESDDEEVEEVEGRKVQMEDLFSPTCMVHIAEDAVSALPPVVIILSDQAEVGESVALEEA